MVMESQRHLEDLVRGKLFVHDIDPARAEQILTKVHDILDGQRIAIEHRARFEKISRIFWNLLSYRASCFSISYGP